MSAEHDPSLRATREFLRGSEVALCVPYVDDAENLARWDNDVGLSILAGDPARPRPVDAARAEITSALEDGGNSWMLFIIRDLEHDQPVGLTELSDINLRHRTATFGIRLGDNETRRRGLGGEAASLTLDYGFVCLDLVNIAAETHVFNTAALALYQRLGFRVIGHRRQAYRLAGIPHDEIHLDCLADEFIRASPPVAVLPPIR